MTFGWITICTIINVRVKKMFDQITIWRFEEIDDLISRMQ